MNGRRRLLAGLAGIALIAVGCGDSNGGDGSSGSASSGSSPSSGSGSKAEDTVNWPIFGRIPARTHYLDQKGLDPPLKQVWEFSDQTLLEFPPVLVKDRLYVADKSGDIRALDTGTGKTVWNYQRTGAKPKGGQPADVTAPLFANGLVIVALEPGGVIALDPAQGKVAWTTRLPTTLQSSPIEIDGRVYLGSDDGTLWGLDAKDGKADSVYKAPAPIKASPSYDQRKIYVGDYDGNMLALDADSGKLAWNTDTTTTPAGGSGGFFSSPSIAGGRVYAGRDDGTVFAFDSDSGKYLWHYTTGGAVYGSPALAPGPGGELTVFIGSYDARLYALAADTGKVSWSEVVGPIPGTATVVDHTVYTSSFKTGNSVGFDVDTHKRVFRYPSPGYTPMISDGVRLFLAGYQSVHAFEPKSNK